MKFNNLKNIWERLIGVPSEQSLEARIFHAVCIFSVSTLIVSVFFNYLIGLQKLSLIMLTVSILVLVAYYYSRYKNKSYINIIFYAITGNIVFSINYYYNSGIDGPSLLIFLASFFLIITIAPPKQYWLWLSLNIMSVMLLLTAQYFDINGIYYTYENKASRYLDIFVSYSVIILLIFSVTKYIRCSYNAEKRAVELKAAELEIANSTKNKLLSIFAHDLRTPLDIIQSYLELLSNVTLTNEEKQTIEKDLLKNTQNMGQMLANLLSWTRTQMDGIKINLKPLNLFHCLEQTIKTQSDIAHKKGISFKNNLNNSVLIIADKDMLQLVIRNLLNNAIKFTQVGGEITLGSLITDHIVTISISDNGIGISESQQKEIFTLNIKSTFGTKKEKGVGLGLLLCKEFIELQKGKIWFESIPQVRTTFLISLPQVIESY